MIMETEVYILHLEDNPTDAELAAYLLQKAGLNCRIEVVQTRETFEAALEREKPDLILSDFTLPGFNGLTALKLAREKLPETPFIFMSGTLGEDNAVESLKAGATDYVLKDRPSRLGAAVRRALQEAGQERELHLAEEAMTQSECKYRQLFECLSEAAALAEAETGRVLDANKQMETLLGRTRSEIVGAKLESLLAPETYKICRAKLGAPGSDADKVSLDGELRCRDGRAIPVNVSASIFSLYNRRLILGLFREL